MDEKVLEKKVIAFKKRFSAMFHGDHKDLLQKYTDVFKNVVEAEKMSEEEIRQRAKNMCVFGLVTSRKNASHLVLSAKDKQYPKADLCRLEHVGLTEDLLAMNKKIPTTVSVAKVDNGCVNPLQTIKVYSKGVPSKLGYDLPKLTAGDIISQIPAQIAPDVSGFCIRLDDVVPLESFNLIMNMYSFEITLYGAKH